MTDVPHERAGLVNKMKEAVRNVISAKAFLAVLASLAFCVLATQMVPVMVSAVTSGGRGLTLYGLEISPDNACEHAHEIIAAASSNNEVALYKDFIDRLLVQESFVLTQTQQGKPSPIAADATAAIDKFLSQSFENFHALANLRKEALDAVIKNCIQRDPKSDVITGPMVALIVVPMLMILVFVYLVLGLLSGLDWPWKQAKDAPSKPEAVT